MLTGSCIWSAVSKYQNWTPKVVRKAFHMGEVWNPVCCHGNRTVKLELWSTFSRILLQRIKHFWYKLAEISLFIIFEGNLVECMTSSPGKFAYFKNLNISGTKRGIWKKLAAFFFSCGLLVYVWKWLKLERCDFRHSTTLN